MLSYHHHRCALNRTVKDKQTQQGHRPSVYLHIVSYIVSIARQRRQETLTIVPSGEGITPGGVTSGGNNNHLHSTNQLVCTAQYQSEGLTARADDET